MYQLTSRYFLKSSAALAVVVTTSLFAACSSNSPATSTTPAAGASGSDTAAAANPASGGSDSSAAGATLDACKLVTQAEAEQALGQAVEPATQDASTAGRSDCDYISSANSGSAVVYVLVTSSDHVKRDFDFAKAAVRAPQPLTGIGQEAFALQLDAPVVQLHFIKNNSYVTLVVTNLADPARLDKAKALALAAAARI